MKVTFSASYLVEFYHCFDRRNYPTPPLSLIGNLTQLLISKPSGIFVGQNFQAAHIHSSGDFGHEMTNDSPMKIVS